jgi:uncharacterized membrane protein YhaH (DUF805 family)
MKTFWIITLTLCLFIVGYDFVLFLQGQQVDRSTIIVAFIITLIYILRQLNTEINK